MSAERERRIGRIADDLEDLRRRDLLTEELFRSRYAEALQIVNGDRFFLEPLASVSPAEWLERVGYFEPLPEPEFPSSDIPATGT